jgi:hypothetical protein
MQGIVAVLSRWEVTASFTEQKFFEFRKYILKIGLGGFMANLAGMRNSHEKVSYCRLGELPTKYLLKQLLTVSDFCRQGL